MSTGDSTWLWRRQKKNTYQSRGSCKIWMDPYGSSNGWLCVISAVVDWPRLAAHTWYLGGHQNPAAPLSNKENLLLLCQWFRIPRDDLHIRRYHQQLSPDKVKVALGPDCDISPHPIREVPLDLSMPYIDMLLGLQKPARGQANNMDKQEESQTREESQTQTIVLPAPEEVLVTLRLQVDSYRPSEVSALTRILLGGTPLRCRNRHLWIQAVQDYSDEVPLCPSCPQLLQFVWETAPQQGCQVSWLH